MRTDDEPDTNVEGDGCRQCDKLEATLERVMRDGRKKTDQLTRENASLRAALRWAYDRLDIDGGMTLSEQRRTVEQIGNTLAGQPSRASDYRPDSDEASIRREKGQWPT